MTQTSNQDITQNTETSQVEVADQPVQDEPDVEVEQSTNDDEPINVDYSKNVKKRIDKLSRKLSDKDQEIQRLQSIIEQKETTKTSTNNKVETSPQGKPTLEQFDTVAEFAEALTDWKLEQIDIKRVESERTNVYNQRVKSFVETAPDFVEAVSELGNDIKPDIADFVIESEIGPELIYHLANNVEEFERISKLSMTRRIATLGSLEQKLIMAKKASAKVIKRPEPISKPSGNSTTTVPSELSYKEWKVLRMSEINKAKQRK